MQATGQKGFINDDGTSGIYQHLVTVLETYSTEQTSKKNYNCRHSITPAETGHPTAGTLLYSTALSLLYRVRTEPGARCQGAARELKIPGSFHLRAGTTKACLHCQFPPVRAKTEVPQASGGGGFVRPSNKVTCMPQLLWEEKGILVAT